MLAKAKARELVEQIKAGLDDLREAIVRLYEGEGWRALGYADWRALCATEFTMIFELPLHRRRELEVGLADQGMSQKDIAATVGKHTTVVADDLKINASRVRPTGIDLARKPKRQHQATPAELERRRNEAARLWNEGYNREDISKQLGISHGTLQVDLATKSITGKRPVAGLKPQGRLKPETVKDWRSPPNVIKFPKPPDTECQIDSRTVDRILNDFGTMIEDLEDHKRAYGRLTRSQQDRASGFASRLLALRDKAKGEA